MRRTLFASLVLCAALVSVATFHAPSRFQPDLSAQGYSGALPNIAASAPTGLGVTYSSGLVTQGGLQQSISSGTLTVANTMTSCQAPAYTACNFVYWASGTSLLTTTTPSTAFAVGNVVVAYVTSTGGNITAVTPAAWAPSTAASTIRPSGSNSGGAYWIPPGNCWYSVATGTLTTPTFGAAPGVTALGLNVVGASSVPVMQVATTNAAVVSTNTISCWLNPPTTVGVSGRGVNVVDAVVTYGIQQTGGVNGTQVAVLASGTMNGSLVFDKIALPAAGASETPSTVTPVRADSGTLTITPVVGSFNAAITTAGAFYTSTFTPAAPIALTTDFTLYRINFPVLCNTTQATTINVAGVLVHYTN